jgi:hypothetical protein
MKHLLLLIRHGESTWNVEHRLPGQLPGIELTGAGRAQAQRLANALTMLPLSSIISSPLARAVETAEYLVQGRALTIQLEPDLMDIELGHWSGQNRDALSQSDPVWKAFVRDPTVAPDGRAPYGSTMHPSVSLHWKLTGHRSCLPSAGIHNLDGYNRPPLRPSKRKVKGTQLGSRTHRGQTFPIHVICSYC